MVKARIPGSSQELYTVSVESMPQYVTNSGGRHRSTRCCSDGRVGKDLLCGVLIALAVICAAVAIFLVVYYVTYGGTNDIQPIVDGTADHSNGTLDSSPLTRHREEESKINSLNNNNHWDQKDRLSLSSTSLPDVGIHEPEFHVEGVKVPLPAYNPEISRNKEEKTSDDFLEIDQVVAPLLPEPSTTSTTEAESASSSVTSSTTTTPTVQVDAVQSETIGKKNETLQIVPDDDVVIEDDDDSVVIIEDDDDKVVINDEGDIIIKNSSSSIITTISTTTTVEPVVINASSVVVTPETTSGFVPVIILTDEGEEEDEEDEEEDEEAKSENQTEAGPEILPKSDSDSTFLAVDTTPWKPIPKIVFPDIIVPSSNESDGVEPRVINGEGIHQDVPFLTEKNISSIATNNSGQQVQQPKEEEDESTEIALVQDLGNMALLVPEDRVRNSSTSTTAGTPTTTSSNTTESTTTTKSTLTTTNPTMMISSSTTTVPSVHRIVSNGSIGNTAGECFKRKLPFCRGILPYSETVLPNWVGDKSEAERNLSVPYFEIIAESECHPRVQQYACAVLEPPCRGNGISLPPCRQFCRAIAEDCKSYVLSALALSVVMDCDRYPQSNDPNVCINLASTTPEGECLSGEYRCNGDNTCIPERWVCDGRQDCSQGDDEFSCGQCTESEFKCESENRCVPLRWRCDGSRDCGDGSDERDCSSSQECGDGQFRCEDGLSCIPLRRVCDGSNHCRDNSDETNCTSVVCQNDDFKCKGNGVCIPRQWICDSNWDCKDGSDEADCPLSDAELLEEGASNSSAEIVELSGNKSSTLETAFNPEKCPLGELLCISDRSCIKFEQLCDGANDCSDGADETDCSYDE